MGVQSAGAERLECGEGSPHSKRSAPLNTQLETAVYEMAAASGAPPV